MVYGWTRNFWKFFDGKMHLGEEVNPALKPKSVTVTVVTIKKKRYTTPYKYLITN